MELWTTFALECAHTSPPPLSDGKLHGHSYVVEVHYVSFPEAFLPLGVLETTAQLIRADFDHINLNDVLPVPTMEALADLIAQSPHHPSCPRQVKISRPTLGCGVIYYPYLPNWKPKA